MTAADSIDTPESLGEPWFSTGSFARAAIVAVPAILLLGGLVARIAGSTETNAWYQSLSLPVFQPPGPLFGIAWAILYTLIGIAFAMVWGTKLAGAGQVQGKRLALGLFAVGFAINLTWSPVFFRLHMISAALGIIAVMLLVAIATTWSFWRVNRLAGWLMLPYCAWLCFAAALNISIMMLNPMADAMQMGI
ncbi:TspO/MBR family protein [Sandarakinorhabdus sp. AAP62]|uniref:TspO/MBR family protein n=1 Tax=Sandarakinorhabdus sp. AAP62 TaxID=1248916 RepID=UPI000319D000|nr:TspO/MBR family protein [Sandarakinorhabdus sp. AAP62]